MLNNRSHATTTTTTNHEAKMIHNQVDACLHTFKLNRKGAIHEMEERGEGVR